METITTTEPVEFDKTTWKTDPNGYARNYYHLTKDILITCSCGKEVKKSSYYKHLKSKNHHKTDLQKLKDTKISLLEIEIKKLKEEKV